MEDTTNNDVCHRVHMTNDEYREELRKIFENINENYKLRWFYLFVKAKIEGSR